MAKTQERQVFHSIRSKQGWGLVSNGRTISRHGSQRESEQAAVNAGRAAFDRGGLGQAVLHKADGEIREERTYGKDPEKTPG